MSIYAVLDIGGHQCKVSPGETIYTDSVLPSQSDWLSGRVMALYNGSRLIAGAPFLKGVKVAAEKSDEHTEGFKVRKFKAKSRYRRVKGAKIIKYGYKITGISEKKPAGKLT